MSRPSIRSLGDTTAGALQPLLLGKEGSRFRFAEDAPLPVSWCGSVATAGAGKAAAGGPGLGDVRAFIESAVERR